MSSLKLAGVMAIFTAGQAFGQSVVSLHLELGGNNQIDRYEGGTWFDAPKPLFIPGSEADDQVFGEGTTITWASKVAAGGVQVGNPGAGQPIWGVANIVMNLELRHDSEDGPLATGVIWHSTMNDGDSVRPAGYPVDISTAAAFAYSFNVGNVGPGRVIDTLLAAAGPQGGPFCGGPGWPLTGNPPAPPKNSRTYPTAEPGKLIGMGAGYHQWRVAAGAGTTTRGIGMATLPNGNPGLGVVPLFEGQIDTSNLPAGTYVLKATPGAGINVLRGDVPLTSNQNAFATAADSTVGDTIRFSIAPCDPVTIATDPNPADQATDVPLDVVLSWTPGQNADSRDIYFGTVNPPPLIQNQTGTSYAPSGLSNSTTYYWRVAEKNLCGALLGPVWSFTTIPPAQPTVTAWRTVRSHGGTDHGITLDPAASGNGSAGPSTDPRQGGVTRLAMDFSEACDFVDFPTITGSDGSTPEPFDVEYFGTTLELQFMPGELKSGVCYTIDLADAIMCGSTMIGGDTTCSFRVLEGDTNSNGVVNLGDALYISTKIGQPVADNAQLDLNADGVISMADALLAKSKIGTSVTCP